TSSTRRASRQAPAYADGLGELRGAIGTQGYDRRLSAEEDGILPPAAPKASPPSSSKSCSSQRNCFQAAARDRWSHTTVTIEEHQRGNADYTFGHEIEVFSGTAKVRRQAWLGQTRQLDEVRS